MDFLEKIKLFQKLIDDAKYIVFFGGAGVSTESGIPDFRSKDGLYNNRGIKFATYEPEYLLSHSCLINEPNVFFEFYRQKMDTRKVKPNITHYKLKEMEDKHCLKAVITQNIDGLHTLAGSKNVYEIHGTTKRAYCYRCGKNYPSDILFSNYIDYPKCECGGMIRPDVTLYEEALPEDTWNKSLEAIHNADLLIIGGTSLTVYPAASLIRYFKGKDIVIINKDKTMEDKLATIVFNNSLGEVFERIK